MNQHYILAGGTGFIGQYLIKHWLKRGIKITVISRSVQAVRGIFGDSVQAWTWSNIEQLAPIQLHNSALILNLCGASIGDKRWTPARKKELLESRIHTTQLLSQLCASHADKSPILLNASAASIYGFSSSTTPVFDEESPTELNLSPPDFLADIAQQWEKATEIAKAHGVHVINLRFGVVLGKAGGMLKKLYLPYQFGLGGKLGDGTQPISWIHIQDVANIIDFLITHPELHGAINLVAPHIVSQNEFAKTFAHTLKRPCFLSIPAKFLRYAYGEMADELLLQGHAVYPKRLIEAGYSFQFPKLQQALENL